MTQATCAVLCGMLIGVSGCAGLWTKEPKVADTESPMISVLRDREAALTAMRSDMASVRIEAAKKEAELGELREHVSQLRRDLGEARQTMLELRQAADLHQAELSRARQEREQLKQSGPDSPSAQSGLHEAVALLAKEVHELKQVRPTPPQARSDKQIRDAQPAGASEQRARSEPVNAHAAVLLHSEGEGEVSRKAIRVIVQAGDTLWSLARKYGTTVEAIRRDNHLTGERLESGRKLVISPSADADNP